MRGLCLNKKKLHTCIACRETCRSTTKAFKATTKLGFEDKQRKTLYVDCFLYRINDKAVLEITFVECAMFLFINSHALYQFGKLSKDSCCVQCFVYNVIKEDLNFQF